MLLKLWWVETDDHSEDWFIVAESMEEAAKLHEEGEGFDYGCAYAEFVVEIPDSISVEPGWPSHELIIEVGGIFINEEQPRIVDFNGRQYKQGEFGAFIDNVRKHHKMAHLHFQPLSPKSRAKMKFNQGNSDNEGGGLLH